MNKKMFALVTVDGTACSETGLCETCFTDEHKKEVANQPLFIADSPPVPGSWEEVTLNDAIYCIRCGHTNNP